MDPLKAFKRKMIIIVAGSLILAITMISLVCIQHMSRVRGRDSVQIMELLCAQDANQINGHLESVEQTVGMLYGYAQEELDATGDIYDRDNAMAVVERTRTMAYGAVSNIETAHAVYLRLNPDLYGKNSVFFLVHGEDGFESVTPTDISAYDKDDVEHVGWYYLPMEYGAPAWLAPYDNRNIGVYMITYAIPIFYEGTYIGVMGMDVDLAVLNDSINALSAYEGGYAYLIDRDGLSVFDAVDRRGDANWLTVSQVLRSGLTLLVTAPMREINAAGKELVLAILLTALCVLLVAVGVAVWFAVKINRSLATELVSAYRSQQAAMEAANRASEAKSDFLSRMSHDIRTPMNAIIGMTAIAGAHLDDRERLKDCLGKISASSRHLLGIINDILDMSKIESGKFEIREVEFNLPELLDELLSMVSAQAKAKNHSINVYLHDIEHEDVVGDEGHLQQALLNILSNAVKYTPSGGAISVDVTERKTTNPHLGSFDFVFEDNGIGMPPELTATIFEPFERGEDPRISKIQGTGLGMTITNSIVQYMGGTIRVESELGKGSKFTISITLKLSDTIFADVTELAGLPILMVDDDQVSCESVDLMLRELGMEGEWVLTGREALEKVAERHRRGEDYFAVILDWKMPEMDGVETARRIRETVGEGIPIIILSAFDWSDIEQEARSAGVNSFLSKPIFRSGIIQAMRSLLHPDAKPERQTGGLHELERLDFSDKRVLLVEDNELNREIATEIISTTEAMLETAEDGLQAVEMVRQAAPGYYDMILMDIQMPRMNGYEAARAIRNLGGDWEKIPIIAMTANTFDEDVQAALGAGMNEHLAKPIDLERLGGMMKRWFRPD